MKAFIADIFPQIQRFSQKLDNLTLLTNQHWVHVDNSNNKVIYIFRNNNQLLISNAGKVEKASWEYLGNKSLLIDKGNETFLFKHGFFDENLLALKVDSRDDYVVFVNENKFDGEINTMDKVIQFLRLKYFAGKQDPRINKRKIYKTDRGIIEVEEGSNGFPYYGEKVFQDGYPAPDGRYKLGFMSYIQIKNGEITDVSAL